MIGTLGEKYAGKAIYGTTDAEIFENTGQKSNDFSPVSPKLRQNCEGFGDIENHSHNRDNYVLDNLNSLADRDFLDTGELEEELVGGAA